MPFFKKSKKANLGSTASEVTLVDPSACQAAAKGTSRAIRSQTKHPKQKPLSSEIDKWNAMEARLAYIINKAPPTIEAPLTPRAVALVPYGSLVWDDRIAAGGCDCGSDDVRLCHEHATPKMTQNFMREQSIKTLFKDLGDVIRRWPVHMVTMSW
ncbi:hypothetical protein MY11210_007709 [Beauveria gryllotalpidicola]